MTDSPVTDSPVRSVPAAARTVPGTRLPTVAWFHCFAGIAGDMALGSLIDAGADLEDVRSILLRLPVRGWDLRAEPVLRGGIAATRAVVTVTDDQVSRRFNDITAILGKADLPERVATRSLAVFTVLAGAEGRLHGLPPERVHFHEVGGHDSLVDIVGTMAALELLGVDEVEASPVTQGSGVIRAAHGILPNPPPAVVELLRDVPVVGSEIDAEMTTPTGAAILAALAVRFGPMPAMHITSSGFGAGSRELAELPNCTQVVVGVRTPTPALFGQPTGPADGSPHGRHDNSGRETTTDTRGNVRSSGQVGEQGPDRTADRTADLGSAPSRGQPVSHLETNVDDATGEQLATAIADLIAAGAHDAWLAPIVMKKGRPAVTVHVLCDPVEAPRLRALLVDRTGSFGVRGAVLERWPQARTLGTVDVDGQAIRVKASRARIKAEHDDVARAAAALGRPLREVAAAAEAAFRARSSGTDSDR